MVSRDEWSSNNFLLTQLRHLSGIVSLKGKQTTERAEFLEVGMCKQIIAGMVLVLFLSGFASTQEQSGSQDRAQQAAERLRESWALKKTSYKKEPQIKEEILLKTVESYQAIVHEFPENKEICAEASFRAGEILRTLKKPDEAKKAFQKAHAVEPEGEFAARALKEIGHLHRRVKEYDQALSFYRRVMEECSEHKDCCADALTWIGKVYLKQEQYEKARTTLIGFVDRFPEFPDEAIRNIDLAAGSLLQEGNAEEARALLAKWRQHFESQLGKDDRLDKKIKKALERMKTPGRLAK
jgi:tetratricopeptide (TPR) repeat protein